MTVLTLILNGTEAGVPPAAPPLAKAAPALPGPAPDPAAEAEASLFQETANPAPEFDAEGHRQVAVARLNEPFGQHIYHVRVQIQAIEKLTHYLKEEQTGLFRFDRERICGKN